jgi:transposase-like protein
MGMDMISLLDRIPDEASAYQLLEEMRWNGRPVCPHCGSVSEKHYFLTPKNGARMTRTGSVSQRRVWKCRDCRKQFTVLVGTIFHGTRVSLRTWILVVFEMCANKNGIAAREIERRYHVKPKTAWFMTQRIREAMKLEPLAGLMTGTIVADETWVGGKAANRPKSQGNIPEYQTPVVSLVNRTTGEVRSSVVPNVDSHNLRAVLTEHVDIPESVLHTDSYRGYKVVGREFADHKTVNHKAREYVRDGAGTNPAESFFAQLKRSIDGTHHAVSREHLHRYLAEFDYRHTTRKMTDGERVEMLMGQVGRRLSYKPLTGR